MEEIEYEVYKEELPKYMAGYGGYKSLDKKPKKIYKIIHTKYIPGYMGYVPSIKSENKFGESYGKETSQSLSGKIHKGSDIPPNILYTSISREQYKDQSRVKTIPTSHLLGVRDKIFSYKKPLSFDTINKFYGVNPNKKDKKICEKQNYEKDYLKFWDFVEKNELDCKEKKRSDFNINNMAYWGVKPDIKEVHPDMKFDPIVGYMGTSRGIASENIIGMSFKKSLKYIEDMDNKKINDRYQMFNYEK